MGSALPEELRDAVDNLQVAEKKVVNGVGIESFTEALVALNECVDIPNMKNS